MTTSDEITLKNGNRRNSGRPTGSPTQSLLALQQIGEERCRSHYEFLDKLASEGDKEAAMFLVNKVLPNAKGTRMIKLPLPELKGIAGISSAQDIIIENVANGNISIEEGEKLSNLVEQKRKIIEASEVLTIMTEIQERVKAIEDEKAMSVA